MKRVTALLILAAGLLIPAGSAHAQFGIGTCGAAGAVEGAVSQAASHIGVGTAVPVSDAGVRRSIRSLEAKECIGDPLTFALKQGIITAITHSIVDWINNGFEGGPSFVTDLSRFLGEVADETRLDFIYNDPALGFLCSPFQLDVRLALAVQQQPFHTRSLCTLGDVSDNLEGFLNGDFSQGGWPAWFRLHTDIQNSPYGGYLLAASELQARINSRQYEETQYLEFGGGFFSKTRCSTGHDGTEVCEIVTPGAQINDQLSQVLGSGFRQLELADEINEIVNALIAQLAQKALTSTDGLRGLSSRSGASSRSYTDSAGVTSRASYLEALARDSSDTSLKSAKEILLFNVESAIDLEENYQTALAEARAALGTIGNAPYACYLGIAGVQAIGSADTPSGEIARLDEQIEASRATSDVLEDVRDRAAGALSTETLNAAADAYDAVLASGVVHSQTETDALAQDAQSLTAVRTDPTTSAQCEGGEGASF